VPVYAQWEVADLLTEPGTSHPVNAVIAIRPEVDAEGTIHYLSTDDVAARAVAAAAAAGTELGSVGVLAHRDHAVRCVDTARRAGMTAAVPAGVELPVAYDPESGQPWTRDRGTYVLTDLKARLLRA
jgi:hypothetical protein